MSRGGARGSGAATFHCLSARARLASPGAPATARPDTAVAIPYSVGDSAIRFMRERRRARIQLKMCNCKMNMRPHRHVNQVVNEIKPNRSDVIRYAMHMLELRVSVIPCIGAVSALARGVSRLGWAIVCEYESRMSRYITQCKCIVRVSPISMILEYDRVRSYLCSIFPLSYLLHRLSIRSIPNIPSSR